MLCSRRPLSTTTPEVRHPPSGPHARLAHAPRLAPRVRFARERASRARAPNRDPVPPHFRLPFPTGLLGCGRRRHGDPGFSCAFLDNTGHHFPQTSRALHSVGTLRERTSSCGSRNPPRADVLIDASVVSVHRHRSDPRYVGLTMSLLVGHRIATVVQYTEI